MNMPYQSWEMLPLGPNHTRLNIAGGKVEISIDIKVIYRVYVCECERESVYMCALECVCMYMWEQLGAVVKVLGSQSKGLGI